MAQFQKQLTALSREMNRLDRFYHQFAKQHAINYNQLIILYELYTQGQCTQKQIREIWIVSKQTINTLCNRFVTEGLIQFTKTEVDGRERQMQLTEQGRHFATPIIESLLQLEATVSTQFGEQRLRDLTTEMTEINQLFDKQL